MGSIAMNLDEETLQQVAKDGTMDYDKWPALLGPLLERLDQIVHDFPVPTAPPEPPSPDTSFSREPNQQLPSDSPTQSREPPSSLRSPRPLPPVPPFDSSTSTTATTNVPESAPASQDQNIVDTLPELLIAELNFIRETLRTTFSERPPHTIQRLAELVIEPKRQYRTLPAWLRAVDRVVSVSTTADIFPLPHAPALPNSVIDSGLLNGLVNGEAHGNGGGILWTNSNNEGLGSDESLGGALLTPIPWMMNRGPEDAGSPQLGMLDSDGSGDVLVPEREDGAVTQGELIRMEQEAGIVPVSQGRGSRVMENGEEMNDEDSDSDSAPHARGPDLVGVEDMGLQNGHDLQLQLGRGGAEVPEMDQTEIPGTVSVAKDGEGKGDADGDVVLVDADGNLEEGVKETTENVGPDGVDTTAL